MFGKNTFKISIEASTQSGWKNIVGKNGITFGLSTYGKKCNLTKIFINLFNLTSDEIVQNYKI